MYRRQLLLLLVLGAVAYAWWQSREPSRYSEWAADLAAVPDGADLDSAFEAVDRRTWEFDSPGDSVWRVVAVAGAGGTRYRVQLVHGDSIPWQLYVDLAADGACLGLSLRAAGKAIRVEPHGDSARFIARGRTLTESWIAWSPDAVLYESIPALCDGWTSTDRPLTLVRIQPHTEVVTRLPAALKSAADGSLGLWGAGKELVRITYASGRAERICLAGGRCLTRRSPPSP